MEIIVQETPNPNARKFVLPEAYFGGPTSFSSVEAAAGHPLATRLFALGGIYNVFCVQDFVTVNKYPDVPWKPLLSQIETVIREYLTA